MNVTVTLELFHPAAFAAGLGAAEIVSAEPSVTLMLDVATLPATSVVRTVIGFAPFTSVIAHEKAVPFTTAFAPLQVTRKTPDNESLTAPATANCERATVAAGVAGEVIVSAGRVLSIFRATDAVAVLPSASAAIREIT